MTPTDLVNFTSEERRKIATLRRRHDHLTALLDDYQGTDKSWTLAERNALRWALSEIMDCRA